MRKILFKDVMSLARIIKKGNLKADIIEISNKIKSKYNVEKNESNEEKQDVSPEIDESKLKEIDESELKEIGLEIMFTIFEMCGDSGVEKELYKMLDSIFEAEKSIENMELIDVVKNFKELAEENDLMLFFKQAGQLMK